MKIAVITGITGQDGSYLAELLLKKGYQVHGIVRRASHFNRSRIEHLRADSAIYGRQLFLHYSDLQDPTTLRRLLRRIDPDEIYHLAGQSHVGLSFEIPESTFHEIATATLSLLEICRDLPKRVHMYHASSSEVFGSPRDYPQTEASTFNPQSPYGCCKVFATNICRVYRQAFGLYVCSGIAYNHESPRRGENFVTRKISHAAAAARVDLSHVLQLGNLNAERDWGYAKEYVEAMWAMLQQNEAEDLILATGRLLSVRDFARAAYAEAGFDLVFEGEGADETGLDRKTGRRLIEVNPSLYRPLEPQLLVGNPDGARTAVGWQARTTGEELAALMVRAEVI